ncbi:uncharacterized protein LOC115893162 [Rhinopithecus roxellana]|uniref:uncharacterized protein LOC115893162 n=1 Tax=Rhinopithecus roxellana TaxID=61622 RepID=UPI00123728AE|nr:uncharacterized protein LOC115893162 [Rhinopithecus roxellana]
MSKLHSRPKESSFLHPEHVDGCGPRAAGEGAAGTPPPGLRPDPCPAATWGEGPRWPPRNRHPGRTRSLRRPRQPELGEGAPPRGAGEGRAGPANVGDLGAGRPPSPAARPRPGGAPPKPREEAAEPSLRPRTPQRRRHGTWESLCALLRATATRREDSEPGPGPARRRHARWCRGVGKLITSRKRRERAPQELERKQPKTRKGAGRTAALEADVTSTAHLPKITEDKPQRMPTTIVNGWPHQHEVLQRSEAPRRLPDFHSLIPTSLMSLTFINYLRPIPCQSTSSSPKI